MDNLMSFGKQAFQAYESHQQQGQQQQGQQQQQQQGQDQQYNVTGSSALNSYDNQRPAQVNYQHDDVVNHAARVSGQDPGMFSQAMQFAQGQQHQDVDEQGLQEAHQQAYSGNAGNMAPGGVGAAAALQALKHFTSSGGNTGGSGGGSMQSQLIAQAMAEASSLFDKSGNTGNKQDAVSSAAASMMKLMMQSQLGIGGGSGAGGLGGMLSMASKFM